MDVFNSLPTKKYQIKSKDIKEKGKFIVVDQGKEEIAGYFDDKTKLFNDLPIIIYGDHTTIVKFKDEPFIVGADGVKLLNSKINANLKYLYYALLNVNIKPEGYKRHFSILKKVKIPISNINEQTKIANFLSLVDKKIELMERKQSGLINYKKGLMQQLFSFNLTFSLKNTSNFKLDELFISKKGSGLSKESLCENGKNSCILYGELYTRYNEIISKVESKTDLDEGILSKKGDILIPASTTTKGEDLVTASIVFDENIYLGGDITILRLKNEKILDSLFFAYYFSNGLVKKIAPLTQGSTIIHLYWKDFKKVSIELPSLNEQKKIADFLSEMDNKIDSVEQQLEKIKEFKKYLLQQMFV